MSVCTTPSTSSRTHQPTTLRRASRIRSAGTKLKLAVELVRRAVQAKIPFRAVVADSFYGEDRGVKQGLRELGVGYVLALKPSHEWWHPVRAIGSFQEAARAARWKSPEQAGKWVKVTRTFRDGSSQDWWALEVVTGP
jgi:SRSO17 transposase